MRITRLEASVAGDTSPDAWPELADVVVPPPRGKHTDPVPPGGWVYWRGYQWFDDPGYVEVAVPGPSTDDGPQWQYGVHIGGAELGTILGCMPTGAVEEVFRAFLRTANPEVLGAVAGRIIAHVATAAAQRTVGG